MSRTLIQMDASSLVGSFIERAGVAGHLKHMPTQGTLKELFVSDVLRQFLTIQFGIGSGVVVDRDNNQSQQTDIVIYDNRIIPPFMSKSSIGVYPVESVIATIEIKTTLNKEELMKAEKAARHMAKNVAVGLKPPPLYAVFGFRGGVRGLDTQERGKLWFEKERIGHLRNICIAGRYCWAKVKGRPWRIKTDASGRFNEIKRFLALLLDSVRTGGEARYGSFLREGHHDWLSGYIRG